MLIQISTETSQCKGTKVYLLAVNSLPVCKRRFCRMTVAISE